MTDLNLAQQALLRACRAGRVRRTTSGYDLWDKPGSVKPARANRRVDELANLGLIHLGGDGLWRPTTGHAPHQTQQPKD